MPGIAIAARNLSKRYRIGLKERPHDTLGGAMYSFLKQPLRNFRRLHGKSFFGARDSDDVVWALRDVSFEILQGDVVGIIGRNGAGKSTLLKILSRITDPTSGVAELHGRVSGLLEVGTGFHPELTGRDNVFLNGTILGMTKKEMESKFDEIVSFAEVEKFIDTPVKYYSSGMRVRLAFAVAAHLEPEVLLIDEVLAVGDVEFQKKSLGKMKDVSRSGRTVLFVSHNMAAVQSLCTKAMYLHEGRIGGWGSVEEQIGRYLSTGGGPEADGARDISLGRSLKLCRLAFSTATVVCGEPVEFTVELEGVRDASLRFPAITLYEATGVRVSLIDIRAGAEYFIPQGKRLTVTGRIERVTLVEGTYSVGFYVRCDDFAQELYNLLSLHVVGHLGDKDLVPYPASVRGFAELQYSTVSTLQ